MLDGQLFDNDQLFDPLLLSVTCGARLTKNYISIISEAIIKKISFESRDYELVDEKSLSAMSRKTTEKNADSKWLNDKKVLELLRVFSVKNCICKIFLKLSPKFTLETQSLFCFLIV